MDERCDRVVSNLLGGVFCDQCGLVCATSVASPPGTACLAHLAARHGLAGGSGTLRSGCRKDLIGVCRRGERQPLTSREVWLRDGQGPKSMSDGHCKGKHEGSAPTQCSWISQTKQIPYLPRTRLRPATVTTARSQRRHGRRSPSLSAEHALAKALAGTPPSGVHRRDRMALQRQMPWQEQPRHQGESYAQPQERP